MASRALATRPRRLRATRLLPPPRASHASHLQPAPSSPSSRSQSQLRLYHRHATSELRQPFLQFFPIVVGRRLVDLMPNLPDARLDLATICLRPDQRGRVAIDLDAFRPSQGQPSSRSSNLTPRSSVRQRPPVRIAMSFQHRLAPIAKTRRLHRAHLQRAANLVHHQRGQRLAFDILGDEQQRLSALGDRFAAGAASPARFAIRFSWIST